MDETIRDIYILVLLNDAKSKCVDNNLDEYKKELVSDVLARKSNHDYIIDFYNGKFYALSKKDKDCLMGKKMVSFNWCKGRLYTS